MEGADLAVLFGRMALTAGIVVVASLVAERAGPFLGAMVATLPLSVGPAYTFLALDHGSAFVAQSALASLVGAMAITPYVLGHLAALRLGGGTLACVSAALGAWALALTLLRLVPWSFPGAMAAFVVFSLAGVALTAGGRRRVVAVRSTGRLWHVAVRAAAVMVLVAIVTLVGRLIGPGAAGSIALLPIVFTSLVMLLQPVAGGEALAGILAHGVVGMLSYGPAFAAIHLLAEPLGWAPALLVALALCIAWNALLIVWRRVRRSPA